MLVLSLFFGNYISSFSSVKAGENSIEDTMYFTEENSAESYLDTVPNVKLNYGDSFINKEALQAGIDYQNKKNAMRTNEEVWTLISSTPYRSYDDLDGVYKERLGIAQGSERSIGFSLSLSRLTKYNIEIEGNVRWSFSYTRSGPSGTEPVGSNYATHIYYVSVASGAVTKYTYKITDKYSGAVIDDSRVVYLVHDKDSTVYGLLGCYNASNDMLIIRSALNNRIKTFDQDEFIDYWDGVNPMDYIGF